jgi:hypothetical protein
MAGLEGDDGDRKRCNQATDDQECFSGKVQRQGPMGPNVFRSGDSEFGPFLRFQAAFNNPWNRATARHGDAILASKAHPFSQKRPLFRNINECPGRRDLEQSLHDTQL